MAPHSEKTQKASNLKAPKSPDDKAPKSLLQSIMAGSLFKSKTAAPSSNPAYKSSQESSSGKRQKPRDQVIKSSREDMDKSSMFRDETLVPAASKPRKQSSQGSSLKKKKSQTPIEKAPKKSQKVTTDGSKIRDHKTATPEPPRRPPSGMYQAEPSFTPTTSAFQTVFTSDHDKMMAATQLNIEELTDTDLRKQEDWALEKLTIAGTCPAGWGWRRYSDPGSAKLKGYRCFGGASSHLVTHALVAEGKGGFYHNWCNIIPLKEEDIRWDGPYYPDGPMEAPTEPFYLPAYVLQSVLVQIAQGAQGSQTTAEQVPLDTQDPQTRQFLQGFQNTPYGNQNWPRQ